MDDRKEKLMETVKQYAPAVIFDGHVGLSIMLCHGIMKQRQQALAETTVALKVYQRKIKQEKKEQKEKERRERHAKIMRKAYHKGLRIDGVLE